jgi:hypothetical protein
MKGTGKALWLLALAAGFVVLGCNKDEGPGDQAPQGVSNEEQAMSYFAKTDEFVMNDEETFADRELLPMNYGTFGKVDAAITPLRFGRFLTSVTTTVTTTIQPGDSVAVAYVKKDMTGVLKIRGINENGDTIQVDKPFNDVAERNILFKRAGRNPVRYWMNWVPVATSLLKGGTVPPNNAIEITKLRLDYANGDSLIVTDPLNYFLRYRWRLLWMGVDKDVPELVPGQEVRLQVTLTSTSPDTDYVALRYGYAGFNRKREQLTLVSQEDNGGTFTRVYETSRLAPVLVHFHRGFFNMGVDAMTKATLFDDAAPYSVSWWGVPYRVF